MSGLGFVEPMEARRFASTSTWTNDWFSDYSSNTFFGNVSFGDNGDATGYATASTGTYGTQQGWSYTTWDSDQSDGVDSGWRSVMLSVNDDPGHVVFEGGGGNGMIFSTASTEIHSVAIMADVASGGMAVDWRSITVAFYHNGSLVETITPSAPSANKLSDTDGTPLESGVVVTPSSNSTTITGVYVSGQVKLRTVEGCYPGSSDLSATIAIS